MKFGLLVLVFLLAGCQKAKKEYSQLFDAKFEKTGVLFSNRMEGTPVVFKGELLYVVSNRSDPTHMGIEIYSQGSLINSFETGTEFASAFVYNDELYIYSTRDLKQIEVIKSADLVSFTTPQIAISGYELFNSSVALTPTGFVMAFETSSPNYFSAHFATSQDLIHWTETNTELDPNQYTACPTIRYSNGFYYVFYLAAIDYDSSVYATYVSRSADLITWERGPGITSASVEEGTNSSDLDFAEYNGKVYFEYADGNQKDALTSVRGGIYNGTLDEFLASLF